MARPKGVDGQVMMLRTGVYDLPDCDRCTAQYESLLRVEAEQKALIEKLSNNEA